MLISQRPARIGSRTTPANSASLVRDLGADDVIVYTAVRFEDKVCGLDVVLETVGGDTLARPWCVLRYGGILVTIAGSAPRGQIRPVRVSAGSEQIPEDSMHRAVVGARRRWVFPEPLVALGYRGTFEFDDI